MKVIIVFSALTALVSCAPQGQNPDAEATIVKYESDNSGIDGYKYSVETSNGIAQEEEGQLQNAGAENEAISVRGSYSWTAPDGKTYTVTYIADENGFQPQGEHIPSTGAIGAPPGAAAPAPVAQSRAAAPPPSSAAPPAAPAEERRK